MVMITILLLILSIGSREWLVFRLKNKNRLLWEELGAPSFLERDHLLYKFPFKGWMLGYRALGLIDRCVLVVFAITSSGFIIGVTLGIWRYWQWR